MPAIVAYLLLNPGSRERLGDHGESRAEAHAERAIDGDTILLAGGEKVRLVGIDTPEKGQPLYAEARRACAELVEGRPVEIRTARESAKDAYGRTLALVTAGGKLVNEELAARGLARIYLKSDGEMPAAFEEGLIRAQNEAIDARRGLWGLRGALETRPGERLLATRYRFHQDGCADLKSARRPPDPITREKALRSGRSPCRNCNPRRIRPCRSRPCRRRLEESRGCSLPAGSLVAMMPPAEVPDGSR